MISCPRTKNPRSHEPGAFPGTTGTPVGAPCARSFLAFSFGGRQSAADRAAVSAFHLPLLPLPRKIPGVTPWAPRGELVCGALGVWSTRSHAGSDAPPIRDGGRTLPIRSSPIDICLLACADTSGRGSGPTIKRRCLLAPFDCADSPRVAAKALVR